jgi:glyoxylase-like metal-dependent hydrolase (beta-lactamase superfamily II)
MKILDDIYAVGEGIYGLGISNKLDSNIYLINGGEEVALIDSGVGVDTERIIENVENEGLNTSKIKKLLGKYTLQIIHTPGHSKGSMCILVLGHEKRVLFSGDTIYMNGLLGLLNLPDSSLADYKQGINNLKDLSVNSLIPSHYGFTLNYRQLHIDMAVESLNNLAVPKMIS